jgi:hypothetical protein
MFINLFCYSSKKTQINPFTAIKKTFQIIRAGTAWLADTAQNESEVLPESLFFLFGVKDKIKPRTRFSVCSEVPGKILSGLLEGARSS